MLVNHRPGAKRIFSDVDKRNFRGVALFCIALFCLIHERMVCRTRCSAAIQALYFLLDHVLRFPFWLILNYRYGLPLWFACAGSFVVLNLSVFKLYYQLRDFVASIAFTELMANERSRTRISKVLKRWQFMILMMCLYLFPTSYVGVWRSLQLNELDGPLWLQYSFLLSYPYVFFVLIGLEGVFFGHCLWY